MNLFGPNELAIVLALWLNQALAEDAKPQSSGTSPGPCDSRETPLGLRVNCSARGLLEIPDDLPGDATELILSYNRLRDIRSGSLQRFNQLKGLDLSHNKISKFKKGGFDGLHRLERLSLEGNVFTLSDLSFDEEVFSPLANLKVLNLKSARAHYGGDSRYPDKAIGRLKSLESLSIDGLTNETFGVGVRNLTALRLLDLSNTKAFTAISRDAFHNFNNTSIKTLNLSNCDLNFIHEDALSYFPLIDTIDYSKNQRLGIRGAMKSTKGLQNSKIQRIFVQHVRPRLSLTTLAKEDMKYIANTSLKEMYIDFNAIGQLGPGLIESLPVSLETISCEWNMIQVTREQMILLIGRMRNVRKFLVSFQTAYDSRMYNDVEGTTVQEAPKGETRAFGNISDYGESGEFAISLPPNLWLVAFSNTYKLTFQSIPALRVNSAVTFADFSHNLLVNWMGPIKGVDRLLRLDMSGNNCKYISPYFFGYATGLQSLNVSHNKIGPRLSELTFHNLTSLVSLDISHNSIERTEPSLLSSMRNLSQLDFSFNYLSTWESDVSSLSKLDLLNLSHNKFTYLSTTLCQGLDVVRRHSQVRVDLRGNQLRCDCDTVDFVRWVDKTSVWFVSPDETVCVLANGTNLPLAKTNMILKFLELNCRSYSALIAVSSVIIGLFGVFLSVSVIYKNRWKLRYLYYMAVKRGQRTGYETLEGNNDDNKFFYDAFISYEDSSRDQVKRDFIPRLETGAGMKLCVDKRDFVAGQYVTDNIMHSISNSKRTVVLITKKFLRSKFCMYEFNMARMEELHTDRSVLIVVVLEDDVVQSFPRELWEIRESQTYLKKSDDMYGEECFWDLLIKAIRSNGGRD